MAKSDVNLQPAKKRGRPRKVRTAKEIRALAEAKAKKLTLLQKQEIRLKRQKDRLAKKIAAGQTQPANKSKFFCNNALLHQMLLKWRNSAIVYLPVYKIVNGKKVKTDDQCRDAAGNLTPELHEPFQDGVQYIVEYNHSHSRYKMWQDEILKIKDKIEDPYILGVEILKIHDKFISDTNSKVVEDVTKDVEAMGWAFNIDQIADRTIDEDLGKMILAIADKLLNHTNFRGYTKELKEDMRGFGILKLIRGLKNYNFKFNNPFSFFTTAFWNAYVTIAVRHYKHLNIKRELMKDLLSKLETYSGIDPRSSLNRCLKNYIGNEDKLLSSTLGDKYQDIYEGE